jgi:hypothetical protein
MRASSSLPRARAPVPVPVQSQLQGCQGQYCHRLRPLYYPPPGFSVENYRVAGVVTRDESGRPSCGAYPTDALLYLVGKRHVPLSHTA